MSAAVAPFSERGAKSTAKRKANNDREKRAKSDEKIHGKIINEQNVGKLKILRIKLSIGKHFQGSSVSKKIVDSECWKNNYQQAVIELC